MYSELQQAVGARSCCTAMPALDSETALDQTASAHPDVELQPDRNIATQDAALRTFC